MTAKIDSIDDEASASGRSGRWAFAALLGGNIALSLGAMLVRLADTGPTASAFWRMTLALPLLLVFAWRETGGRMPPRPALLIAAAAGVFFALDLAAWHLGILQTKVANATLFGNCASLLLVIWGIFLSRAMPRGATREARSGSGSITLPPMNRRPAGAGSATTATPTWSRGCDAGSPTWCSPATSISRPFARAARGSIASIKPGCSTRAGRSGPCPVTS